MYIFNEIKQSKLTFNEIKCILHVGVEMLS